MKPPDTRRNFLQSAASAAAGLTGAAALSAQNAPQAAMEIQVPKMKFAGVEISRLIAGCNTFYGFAHFNQTLATVMREYYTPERVCDVLHQCNRFGINAFNYYPAGRASEDFERFVTEGGKMHLVAQGIGEPSEIVKA